MRFLVCRLQEFGGLFLRALGVVLGANGEVVLVHGALPLPGDVEDLAQIDVRPDFGPLGLEVAVQRLAEFELAAACQFCWRKKTSAIR
jgi:hypothetical protein